MCVIFTFHFLSLSFFCVHLSFNSWISSCVLMLHLCASLMVPLTKFGSHSSDFSTFMYIKSEYGNMDTVLHLIAQHINGCKQIFISQICMLPSTQCLLLSASIIRLQLCYSCSKFSVTFQRGCWCEWKHVFLIIPAPHECNITPVFSLTFYWFVCISCVSPVTKKLNQVCADDVTIHGSRPFN